jgi:chromosome segregation ATPase
MDVKNRIEIAQVNLRQAENAKTVAETQKKTAEESLTKVIADMATKGVTPETVGDEITKLEASINTDLDTIEKLIPAV